MTYYTDVSKKRQADNDTLRALTGAPEGACFIPGLPVAYCCQGDAHTFALHLRYWQRSGRCVRKAVRMGLSPGTPKVLTFELQGERFCARPEDYMVWREATPPPAIDMAHRARAAQFFYGQDVALPRAAVKGDNNEAASRAYARRKEEAMARCMPPGFLPLPGGFDGSPAAYRIEDFSVVVVRPTTAAVKNPAVKDVRKTIHPIHGSITQIGESKYRVLHGVLHRTEDNLIEPMNLPDRTGWAQNAGTHVEIVTPTGTHRVPYANNRFDYCGSVYLVEADKIVTA